MTVVSVKMRYLYCFGGATNKVNYPEGTVEVVRRLDTQHMNQGWDIKYLPNPRLTNGSCYGVIPLPVEANTTCKFLVFGGMGARGKVLKTLVFTTSLPEFDFEESSFEELPSPLPNGDRFDLNQHFLRTKKGEVGTFGQQFIQAFDTNSMTWIQN
jgi:hypothetical protein